MHKLILGRSGYGKSSLAKLICAGLTKSQTRTTVLDVTGDAWPASAVTTDPKEYFRLFWETENGVFFVDEGGEVANRKEREMVWTATRGRHQGHTIYFLAHRLKLLDVTLRGQCDELFIFGCAKSDAFELADEYGCEALEKAHLLGPLEFIHVSPTDRGSRWKIDFKLHKAVKVQSKQKEKES